MFKKLKNFFREKKIIIVSDNNIKIVEINNFSRFIKLLFYCWVVVATIYFIINTKIQFIKDKKIDELKVVNSNLNNNIIHLNYVINDIKGYLYTLNYYDRFDKINVKQINDVEESIIKNNSLISINEYKEILPILDNIERDILNIDGLIKSRIDGINELLKEASLDKEVENIYKVGYQSMNIKENENVILKNSILLNKNNFYNLKEKINYLTFLESFLNYIPVTKPINNYYLSSNFGTRIDPFTKEARVHKGIDFAGPYNSVIYAPADGIVEIVSVRGGFGNSIQINHGNNILTEYAHLDRALVKVGDIVKRGDKIAIQGSTGRSTGQHLHWEIKINNKNVDPIKFIKIGEKIY